MNLEELQKNWDQLGESDAMWAVLTDPSKKGGKWTPEEFFKTGETEIAAALSEVAGMNIPLNRGCALDFGCGVGRLTQALAGQFAEAHGVDIAPSMVKQARQFNRFPHRCHYHLNARGDLQLFKDQQFDFIYSFIVLQHMESRYVLDYLREFTRVLRPGGIAMFQLIEPPAWRALVPGFLLGAYRKWRQGNAAFVWEFGAPQAKVEAALRDAGASILRVRKVPGAKKGWNDLTYIVTKPAPASDSQERRS